MYVQQLTLVRSVGLTIFERTHRTQPFVQTVNYSHVMIPATRRLDSGVQTTWIIPEALEYQAPPDPPFNHAVA